MKKTFYTPQGAITRDLTNEEVSLLAASDDFDCKKEILKKNKAQATSIEQRVSNIEEYLGV